MNYVVIKAGGTGLRMQPSECPKQFLEVEGKPIIVYTLEKFQNNQCIAEIYISCLVDWIDYMWDLVEKYNLYKVKGVVKGDVTGHLSTRNGVYALKGKCVSGDVVTIHDAVRPEFTDIVLEQSIETAKEYGAAVVCAQCLESMFLSEDGTYVSRHQPNFRIYRAQAPQSYEWDKLIWAYEEADRREIYDAISTDNLYSILGIPQRIVLNGQHNFKITTWEDVHVFSALIKSRNEGSR